MCTAPNGIQKLRELILTLAVQGKLVPQDPSDEPASVLLQKIRAEKDRLIAEGKIKREKVITQTLVDQAMPAGWQFTLAHELCFVITDGDHLPPPKADVGVPFLVIGDVRNGTVGLSTASRFVPRSYFDELAWSKKPIPGDVLYTTVGSFGIPVPIIDDQDFCFQRHIALFRPGLVDLHVLRGLQLSLPPLAEQTRIVARVTQLRSLCADLRQRLSARQATHGRLAEALVET